MTAIQALPVFSAYGIELEYMIVSRGTLSVEPIADRLLQRMAGYATADIVRGNLGWSNELVLHVVELKNVTPNSALDALATAFANEIRDADRTLSSFDAMLMPTGMHPWMDPRIETRLWPHDNADVYGAFDRIFDCRTHGWANLQSMHINLPFSGDDQFARLHAAIRLVLPLIPALAASSPLREGRRAGALDSRLEAYRGHTHRVPAIVGDVIPDPVSSRGEYEQRVLEPIYDAIARYDRDGVLRHEWLNARGAIARFGRNAIEIRLADTQECPAADIAVACAVCGAVKALYDERWTRLELRDALPTPALSALLARCIAEGEQATVDDPAYLRLFGFDAGRCRAAELWAHIIEESGDEVCGQPSIGQALDVLIEHGPLARRILRAVGPRPSRAAIESVYQRLCECLERGEMLVAA
jgi:gamma-glutamyl:cysteine ligase YbdK (ATP-grasp superfamily)